MNNTPETDNERTLKLALEVFTELANTLKRERDEAREAFKELWQISETLLPELNQEQLDKWHKAIFTK